MSAFVAAGFFHIGKSMKSKLCKIKDFPLIKEMHYAGKSNTEIAEFFNVSQPTISRVLRNYGIKKEPKNKPKRVLDFHSNDYTG